MLRAVLGQGSGPTKSNDVLDAALWDIRVKQYLGTTRVYVHLTAFLGEGLNYFLFSTLLERMITTG
jgi:hypothetical protein